MLAELGGQLILWTQGAAGSYLVYALAGVLGAVVSCALEGQPLLLPRLEGNRLELGFLGNLAASGVVAQVADHSFPSAFVAALCATTVLRALKRRVEEAFAAEEERLQKGGRG